MLTFLTPLCYDSIRRIVDLIDNLNRVLFKLWSEMGRCDMKKYDFETVIHRRRTGSMKWQELEAYGCPEDVIPFSVADMELKNMPQSADGWSAATAGLSVRNGSWIPPV